MSLITVEILSGLFALIIFLLLLFYIYPEMKREWTKKGRDFRYYYIVCGDNNKTSYRKFFYLLLSIVVKK